MTVPNSVPAPAKDGLQAAAEYLKYTLALATGSLVFSAGLVDENVVIPVGARCFLITAWVVLVLAIVAGLITFARVPVLLRDADYDIEDALLVWPWRVHQVTFGFGVICLGVALVLILLAKGAA